MGDEKRRQQIAILRADYEAELRIASARRRIVEAKRMIERARRTKLAAEQLRRTSYETLARVSPCTEIAEAPEAPSDGPGAWSRWAALRHRHADLTGRTAVAAERTRVLAGLTSERRDVCVSSRWRQVAG